VPRELGGADDERNLWPQPLAEARVKDRQENALHRAVCAGTVTLAAAQAQMRQWGHR
jgi:putative intracellular protease/amidase